MLYLSNNNLTIFTMHIFTTDAKIILLNIFKFNQDNTTTKSKNKLSYYK